jgi:hypothetical protein
MARDNFKDMQDADLKKSAAMANAAGTADTASIDLGDADPSQRAISVPDLLIKTTQATGVTGHVNTLTVQDSADNSSFAAVALLPAIAITAASSAYAATTVRLKLPRTGVRRYIRLHDATDSGGGNATDGTMTIALAF